MTYNTNPLYHDINAESYHSHQIVYCNEHNNAVSFPMPHPNLQFHINYQEMIIHLSSPSFSSDNMCHTILSLWLYCYTQVHYRFYLCFLDIPFSSSRNPDSVTFSLFKNITKPCILIMVDRSSWF